MKTDRIYWKWFNVIWVCFWVGVATGDVGEKSTVVVYHWWLPIFILVFLLPGLVASLLPDKDS